MHREDVGVGVEHHLGAKGGDGRGARDRICQGPEGSAAPEHAHSHAEPVKRLAELDAHRAGAEHCERFGQRRPCENVIARDDPVAHRVERGGHGGRGSRRDDDGAGFDRSAVDLQDPGRSEMRVTFDPVFGRNGGSCLPLRGDESIALSAQAVHHGASVHLDGTAEAERSRVPGRMGDLGGGD